MKTFGTIIAATLLLMPWSLVPIFGQESTPSAERKITIIKRTVDADGTETTETIIKKGKAAENFDVDKYIAENRDDKVRLEVRVDDGTDEDQDGLATFHYQLNKELKELKGLAKTSCNDSGAFLGVEQDSDEDMDVPGLTVQVVKGSAAAKAGLKTNDVILKLNDTPVNVWKDLSKIIDQAKPGDKIRIAYSRNGAAANTEATLTKHSELPCTKDPQGFLGVSPAEEHDDDNNPGLAVNIVNESAAAKAGLQDGDVILKLNDAEITDFEDISDVMTDSKPGDKIQVTYERAGKRSTVDVTAGEQKSWNADIPADLNMLDPLDWKDEKGIQIDIREKDACLGVYTGAYSTNNQKGTRVDEFTEDSPARDVQMAVGDVITAVNGAPVASHDDLWNQIAAYKPGDKVKVDFLRDGEVRKVEATLKACKDNASQVIINRNDDGGGKQQTRQFYTWNWGKTEERSMRDHHVITIHRGEGDASKADPAPTPKQATDRSLKLQAFRAFPNPTQGQVTLEFQGDPIATVVSLFDLAGRQLFREELNAFDGDYSQQFDLSEYAKGTIMIQVVQGDKVYTEQIVVN